MSTKRKQYSPEFKAKDTLAAVRNEQTIAELASRFGGHPTMINNWKRDLLKNASEIFDKGKKSQTKMENQGDELYRQIGKLKVERVAFPKLVDTPNSKIV